MSQLSSNTPTGSKFESLGLEFYNVISSTFFEQLWMTTSTCVVQQDRRNSYLAGGGTTSSFFLLVFDHDDTHSKLNGRTLTRTYYSYRIDSSLYVPVHSLPWVHDYLS